MAGPPDSSRTRNQQPLTRVAETAAHEPNCPNFRRETATCCVTVRSDQKRERPAGLLSVRDGRHEVDVPWGVSAHPRLGRWGGGLTQ
jgi:hypothetical protein